MESSEIKNYLVKFTFEIPVKVIGDTSEEEAYFKARDEFCEFNTSEADISVTPITEEEYQKRRDVINKQHEVKW